MNKPRLFIGVACHKPTAEFVSSLGLFLLKVREKYDVTYQEVWGEELVVAQNRIARSFISSHTDWLLMLEDDHSGHTVEMLDDLINSGHRLCGVKYHARWYPFIIPFLRYDDSINILRYDETEEYISVDLIGFGMTAIHRSVFDMIDVPYFEVNDKPEGTYATDRKFCLKAQKAGIQPYMCNKYCLKHRDVDDGNFMEKMMEFPYRDYLMRAKRKRLQNA